ncbi:galactoside-binding lectin domain-containing protein [Phthorimaea operculella]|nr:galactoside-binding lectin domain-containing protein [Phthorimaea operculella]
MSVECLNCLKMEYGVEEGIPRDFIDFEFIAQDALEFELQLAEARDVKFTQTLSEPLAIGSLIVCTGTPSEDIPWFAINIGCDEVVSQTEIAVHFNVRMPQVYVVRNTRRHNKWGPEETTSFRLFPFKQGREFTIEILVDEKETLWAVDGEHYCSYWHRNPSPFSASWVQVVGVRDATLTVKKTDIYPTLALPPQEYRNPSLFSASWVQVVGVRDATLTVKKTDIYPTLALPPQEVPLRSSIDAPPENEPSWRPHVIAKLSEGIPEGHQIVVRGRLRPMLHSFAIDLMDCAREWPFPNVHAHVNVRAHDDAQRDRQLVVLNAWLGSWGPERRQRTAKLTPGTETTIRIVRSGGEWAVYADDMLIGELEYRAAAAAVRAVRVRGDLYPEEIYVCPATTSPVKEDC